MNKQKLLEYLRNEYDCEIDIMRDLDNSDIESYRYIDGETDMLDRIIGLVERGVFDNE